VAYSSAQGFTSCIPNYIVNGISGTFAFSAGNSTATNTWIVYVGLANGTPIIEFIPNSSNVQNSFFVNVDFTNPANGYNGTVTQSGNTYTFSGTMYSYNTNSSAVTVTTAAISGVISCK